MRGSAFRRRVPSSSTGDLMKVLRCRPPSRANSAFSRPGDHAEDAHLFGVLHLGLKADHVPQRAERIVLPQLHDGEGAAAGLRVGQADGLHRAEARRVAAAFDHHLDGHAAIEIGDVLPLLEAGFLGRLDGVDEGVVFGLVHRAVEVVLGVAILVGAVPARLRPDLVHVDGIAVDDRRDGVEKGQRLLAGGGADGLGERRGGRAARWR